MSSFLMDQFSYQKLGYSQGKYYLGMTLQITVTSAWVVAQTVGPDVLAKASG